MSGEGVGAADEGARPATLRPCLIPHHTEDDNLEEHGSGGLMTIIDVAET